MGFTAGCAGCTPVMIPYNQQEIIEGDDWEEPRPYTETWVPYSWFMSKSDIVWQERVLFYRLYMDAYYYNY